MNLLSGRSVLRQTQLTRNIDIIWLSFSSPGDTEVSISAEKIPETPY